MIDNDFRRGQDGAWDAMWTAFARAENLVQDDNGTTDPHARAVLAVVRAELTAAVDAVQAEWECDERVERVRAHTEKLARGSSHMTTTGEG